MIVLKITNASEVVASKLGKFLGSLSPESLDDSMMEDILVKKLVENLSQEGLKGEVASVNGLDLADTKLVLGDKLHVRRHQLF
ncbi:hypothetical protein [Cyanobium sp. ATX 6F1]|uniref:hypothetical protein n=1 Tax=unclassified Cyanobium TaxID=2627006 RepID=UPI0020CBEE0D|nr:hypothetical protein [Cyanobium sp. ATX 6F1]MCP9915096.1 hypothetical protein [Cyanobium sp. ATX 6F1]